MSTSATREDIYYSNWGSPSSLLRMVGGFGLISGPGMFMIRCMTSGILTALCLGVAGATTSALVWGTAGLPFLICSCAGFVIGSVGWYQGAERLSLIYLDRYPRLIQLHLDANFPTRGFDRWSREALVSSNFRSWQMRNMLTAAWLSAGPSIERITETQDLKLTEAQDEIDEKEDSRFIHH